MKHSSSRRDFLKTLGLGAAVYRKKQRPAVLPLRPPLHAPCTAWSL
ncbi:MAG: twin-arginine translocation signal domain-containing protein [Candidatus Aminicenantes bacterium]|nr:twin-arginine translocation signal domain-containing protein [Candidatus Aminicenantes bacterium]